MKDFFISFFSVLFSLAQLGDSGVTLMHQNLMTVASWSLSITCDHAHTVLMKLLINNT